MSPHQLIKAWRKNADCFNRWSEEWKTSDNKEKTPNEVMAATCWTYYDSFTTCANQLEAALRKRKVKK